jgi:hypothetical protein
MAITINAQGQVLQNGKWVDTDQKQYFLDQIEKAKRKHLENGGAPIDGNTTFAVVEKGDYLFKIGRQYGVNERQISYTDNEQFEANADLIHAGNVVFVKGGNAAAGDRPGSKVAGDVIPASQPQGPAGTQAPGAGEPQPVALDLSGKPTYEQTLAILKNPKATSLQRQAALEAYLVHVDPAKRQGEIDRMKGALDVNETSATSWDRTAVAQDMNLVMQRFAGSNPPTVTNRTPFLLQQPPIDPLAQIKQDGIRFSQSPTDANRKTLHMHMKDYLGPVGSPGYEYRLRQLQQDDCGQGVVSQELPLVFAQQIENYNSIGRDGKAMSGPDVRGFIRNFLQALPPDQRAAAVQKLMDYFEGSPRQAWVESMAESVGVEV